MTDTPPQAPGASAAAAPPLLRKLRIKFIALNMGVAALVLIASFTALCYMDYRGDVDEVYRTLAQAASRAGERPQLVPDPGLLLPDEGRGPAPEPAPVPEESGPAMGSIGNLGEGGGEESADEHFAPPEIGGAGGMGENPLPVATYYCTDGSALQLADHSSAAVPEPLLTPALASAAAATESHGYLPEAGLFYAKREVRSGLIVAFADGAAGSAWHSLAWSLAGIGVGALGVLFLLNLHLSRWALRPVQRAWTQQQQFIADASHELKTPLTVILANNAILRQRGDETVASQGQWIESTQMEAERMQALVTDMLDLARPVTDRAQSADEAPAVDFSRLVEGEALTFEAVAFERTIDWKSTVAEGVWVRGNASRLQRAVAVLLDNACKYTEPGGTVAVQLHANGSEAVLAVHNSGDPIDPADLPHLFDRFYRATKARTHGGAPDASDAETGGAPDGYGLGLAIAQDIARAHRGTLAVTSTAEAGTTFTLRLPLA